MYLRAIHAELDIPSLHAFIKSNPLGLLITSLQSPNFPLIQCTHLPWLLDVPKAGPASNVDKPQFGRLRAHLARANPHSKAMIEAMQRRQEARQAQSQSSADDSLDADPMTLETDVTVMFNGPADAYIPPKFYTYTKPTTGKIVPTWNYSAVQATGRARVYFDARAPETAAFLQQQVEDLTRHAEVNVMGYDGDGVNDRQKAWKVSDAPEPFIEIMKKAIIGIEIWIDRLEGKYKMSQEVGKAEDHEGIIEGLRALKTENADKVASTIEERAALRDAKKVSS